MPVSLDNRDCLALTQFLVFEICPTCNLAGIHKGSCPSYESARYLGSPRNRYLDDETILECTEKAYKLYGFQGLVCFHYFNEPMMEWRRLRELLPRIKERVPEARFGLWTNGTLMPPNLADLQVFSRIWITAYPGHTLNTWDGIRRVCPNTWVCVLAQAFDSRLRWPDREPDTRRCLRPFNELILDYYGNLKLCCWAWSQIFSNVFKYSFEQVVHRYVIMRDDLAQGVENHAPGCCMYCSGKQTQPGLLVPEIALKLKEKFCG